MNNPKDQQHPAERRPKKRPRLFGDSFREKMRKMFFEKYRPNPHAMTRWARAVWCWEIPSLTVLCGNVLCDSRFLDDDDTESIVLPPAVVAKDVLGYVAWGRSVTVLEDFPQPSGAGGRDDGTNNKHIAAAAAVDHDVKDGPLESATVIGFYAIITMGQPMLCTHGAIDILYKVWPTLRIVDQKDGNKRCLPLDRLNWTITLSDHGRDISTALLLSEGGKERQMQQQQHAEGFPDIPLPDGWFCNAVADPPTSLMRESSPFPHHHRMSAPNPPALWRPDWNHDSGPGKVGPPPFAREIHRLIWYRSKCLLDPAGAISEDTIVSNFCRSGGVTPGPHDRYLTRRLVDRALCWLGHHDFVSVFFDDDKDAPDVNMLIYTDTVLWQEPVTHHSCWGEEGRGVRERWRRYRICSAVDVLCDMYERGSDQPTLGEMMEHLGDVASEQDVTEAVSWLFSS